MKQKIRLDIALVNSNLVNSRSQAQGCIMAGLVFVNNLIVTKAGYLVDPNQDRITLKSTPRFVSRGGEKLAHALTVFKIHPDNWHCLDVGASTGGFTDCLLQAGAASVIAIDVGYGQLDWRLRQDSRVTLFEKTNIRYWQRSPEMPCFHLAVVDVSFISLLSVLPAVLENLSFAESPQVIALLKPQFEFLNYCASSRKQFDGVVRHRDHYEAIVTGFSEDIAKTMAAPWKLTGATPSPIMGPKGNQEFLLWLRQNREQVAFPQIEWKDILNEAFSVHNEGTRSS